MGSKTTMTGYAILWAVATTATLIVDRAAKAAQGGQNVLAVGPATAMLGWRAVVAPVVFGIVVVGIAFLLPWPSNVFLGGGLALSQLAALGSAVRSLINFRGLARPNLVEGQVRFSSEMRYRLLSAEMLAAAVIFAGLFAVLRRMEFAGAVLFQTSTSIGYWRQARKAATPGGASHPRE